MKKFLGFVILLFIGVLGLYYATIKVGQGINDHYFPKEFPTNAKLYNNPAFSTKGKSTRSIDTPWGLREVYDPMKDSEVKQAFRQIMKIKQEANYFNDWPEDILDRVQIHTHITHINRNKVDLNLPAKFEAIERKSPEIRDYLSIVLIAKTAQSLDYTRSNCEHINNLQCGKSVDWLSFEAKCEQHELSWGHFEMSSCEQRASKRTLFVPINRSRLTYCDEVLDAIDRIALYRVRTKTLWDIKYP